MCVNFQPQSWRTKQPAATFKTCIEVGDKFGANDEHGIPKFRRLYYLHTFILLPQMFSHWPHKAGVTTLQKFIVVFISWKVITLHVNGKSWFFMQCHYCLLQHDSVSSWQLMFSCLASQGIDLHDTVYHPCCKHPGIQRTWHHTNMVTFCTSRQQTKTNCTLVSWHLWQVRYIMCFSDLWYLTGEGPRAWFCPQIII